MIQTKQSEWTQQWQLFKDDELFLFQDWIYPNRLEDFRDKKVLECGCGGGQHTAFIVPYAGKILAVDLNTIDIAKERNRNFSHVSFLEADIAEMDLGEQFDIVFSVGVIHHTLNPEKTVENLKRHLVKNGTIILWVYSQEGNFLARHMIEPIRKIFLRRISRKRLSAAARLLTFILYVPVYTIYLLPLTFLPYYDYFKNFRKLSFGRNTLNVFDKLNAPHVDFISKERIQKWFDTDDYYDIHISPYRNVSWRISAKKK